jgi:hypothetical protein
MEWMKEWNPLKSVVVSVVIPSSVGLKQPCLSAQWVYPRHKIASHTLYYVGCINNYSKHHFAYPFIAALMIRHIAYTHLVFIERLIPLCLSATHVSQISQCFLDCACLTSCYLQISPTLCTYNSSKILTQWSYITTYFGGGRHRHQGTQFCGHHSY